MQEDRFSGELERKMDRECTNGGSSEAVEPGSRIKAPGLTLDGCRTRQQRLHESLVANGIGFAFTTRREAVHYLTGYWEFSDLVPVACLVERNGKVILYATEFPDRKLSVDDVVDVPSLLMGTIREDPLEGIRSVLPDLRSDALVAVEPSLGFLFPRAGTTDLQPLLNPLRRAKDKDEVDLIRFACSIGDKLYDAVPGYLSDKHTEVELFADLLGLATRLAGEPLSRFGNDFQSGAPGGPPRCQAFHEGDLMALDLTVGIRGYRSDACRTFCTGESSVQQKEAYRRVFNVFKELEGALVPGVETRQLFSQAREMLDGYGGWEFTHHLGHGIGIDQHEAPRLNPFWKDTLQAGDVLTLEPGLYGPRLRPGIRIENAFYLGPDQAESLTLHPVPPELP